MFSMAYQPPPTRRTFLKDGAAAGAAFTIVPRHVLGGPGQVAPSDKVNIAVIGAGGQGRTNLRPLFEQPDAQIIAVADPAEYFDLEAFYFKGMAGRKPVREQIERHYARTTPNYRCAEYVDFREMLDREKAIDAILCATPDHLHACVTVLAMRAGKHVYCEKPLTHNIWEARYVAKVAADTRVATQLGNQGHSTDTIRETVELLRAGAIGPVREAHVWVPNGRWNVGLMSRPTDTPLVPAGLKWDLWLGPREPRPYHPAYFPVTWRDFWAFGGGNIADFGCHDLDAACWAFNLAAPASVEFSPAGHMDHEIAPHGSLGEYRFAARGNQSPLVIKWYDGGLRPSVPDSLLEGQPLIPRGVLFIGDKGAILTGGSGGTPRLLPDSKYKGFARPKPTIPRSKGHHRDWLDACKGGPPASSHFEYGARLTELSLLGTLALRLGRRVDWDPDRMEVKGQADAEPMIREPYRAGWELGT
jgi:predicted dehydrogenase